MPIYEYICESCRNKFEVLERRASTSGPGSGLLCPSCSSPHISRLFSSFAVSSGRSSQAGTSGASCSTCSRGSCSGCS